MHRLPCCLLVALLMWGLTGCTASGPADGAREAGADHARAAGTEGDLVTATAPATPG